MVDGIGRSDLARAAIEAALRAQSQQTQRIDAQVAQNLAPSVEAPKAGFESSLNQLISNAESAVRSVDELPIDMVSGKLGDLHEVVGRLKTSELSFKFALEVRNKLIDAYRETMRMSV